MNNQKTKTKNQSLRYLRNNKLHTLQQTWSYRHICAGALLLLFSTFWSLKTGHILLAHHHESEEHPVCEVSHDPKSAHIHDERWAFEDCSICAFVVSVLEPYALPGLPIFSIKTPISTAPIFYQTPLFAKKDQDAEMLRGPPTPGKG